MGGGSDRSSFMFNKTSLSPRTTEGAPGFLSRDGVVGGGKKLKTRGRRHRAQTTSTLCEPMQAWGDIRCAIGNGKGKGRQKRKRPKYR